MINYLFVFVTFSISNYLRADGGVIFSNRSKNSIAAYLLNHRQVYILIPWKSCFNIGILNKTATYGYNNVATLWL